MIPKRIKIRRTKKGREFTKAICGSPLWAELKKIYRHAGKEK